jgi:IrrE N-terminal-like domain
VDSKEFKETSSSAIPRPRLGELFATRVGGAHLGARGAMRDAVTKLRRRFRRTGGLDERMGFYLRARQIVSVRVVDDLAADGALEPIGSRYVHGFNILLSRELAHTRLQFTLAHEICHTFFYEFVPEIKFVPHATDETEERLCNFGAAELLMPETAIARFANDRPVCIQSLRELAEEFSVSLSAMFIRLRSLRLWDCVLSEWQRMINGTFVLSKFYGGPRRPWVWEDPSILDGAWRSYRLSSGTTVFHYETEDGGRYYVPSRFQTQRFGDRLFALWGKRLEIPADMPPLFANQPLAA